ncbi:hypothetical protein FHT91_005202 [Rhizobium sp. BK347]|nr:hypothetical protein [Rhizobium sp. BK252]MBB3404830.1 hypothetical protein [Rhizobium sp. BK289]MBB3417292.1 hypothetical protein [Rhizobium sp. BK284]MBB3485405.1 hypothetical protein [Rhizobium sp. BK347]
MRKRVFATRQWLVRIPCAVALKYLGSQSAWTPSFGGNDADTAQ